MRRRSWYDPLQPADHPMRLLVRDTLLRVLAAVLRPKSGLHEIARFGAGRWELPNLAAWPYQTQWYQAFWVI